ncbi:Dihydroorotate dehydrogenase (quinone), mitochondrial [Allomyces javanicus]|nr:Dihydroorotate dehydrogenase (quinone), mitochondrial [Allomyces javanicus]
MFAAPAARAASARLLRTAPTLPARAFLSSTAPTAAPTRSTAASLATLAAGCAAAGLVTVYALDVRAGIHRAITMPLARTVLDPETAHKVGVRLARWGLAPRDRREDDAVLRVRIWGKDVSNPVGLAAGFDKNGEGVDAVLGMGFGSVEVGSITPVPQPGNPQPRVFRLPADNAIINRYGFNSDGHQVVLERLQHRVRRYQHAHGTTSLPARHALVDNKLLGVNLGKNKTSAADDHSDYVRGIKTFAPVADYLVVNVSSPNTPGLRSLQRRETLAELIGAVIRERNAVAPGVPVALKIAPDMTREELADVSAVALAEGADALIVSNTTIQRPATLKTADQKLVNEMGGLSGPPVRDLALQAVRTVRACVGDQIPIIGCGGISNANDALAFARAGATMVQVYTALAMDGPHIAASIKDGVTRYCKEHGTTWMDLVGADAKGKTE